jgi:hypothetical protein
LGFNLPNVFKKLEQAENGDGTSHTDSEAPRDPTKSTLSSSRPITFVDLLPSAEKEIYDLKIKEVVDAGIVQDVSKLVFTFSAQNYKSIGAKWKIYLTPSKDFNSGENPILNNSQDYWSSVDGKDAYTCASIIELLLALGASGSGLKIKGTIGATNVGFSGMKNGEKTDMGTITDHTFGRAFDITAIGKSVPDMLYLSSKNLDNYKRALDMLLAKLNTVPEYLHPDLIIIDNRLIDEYGIGEGFESDFVGNKGVDKGGKGTSITNAGIIFKKYETLKKINFTASAGHRDHIHLSFGPNRTGSYKDWLDTETQGQNEGEPESGFTPEGDASQVESLAISYSGASRNSYYGAKSAIRNPNALYKGLIDYGNFTPEEAAIFMCIAERESNFQPGAFNGLVNNSNEKPKGTGDYSIGLWQVNFKGIVSLLTNKITLVDSYTRSVDGKITFTTSQEVGYKLIDKNWQQDGVKGKDSALRKMKEWYKTDPNDPTGFGISEGRQYTDERMFKPIVQIFILKQITQGRHGWIFSPWGEYPGAPVAGWLRELKFQTAVNFYIANNPTKTIEDLRTWVKQKGSDKNANSSKLYLDRWLQGYVFNSDGTIDEDKSTANAAASPDFTKTQIEEAAKWLRINRLDPWEAKYSDTFGCEGFVRMVVAGLGLSGLPPEKRIFTQEWPKEKFETAIEKNSSATAHYNKARLSGYFNRPGTVLGDNPEYGMLVYFTGGSGQNAAYGHVAVSLGDGRFIDQHTDKTPSLLSQYKSVWPGSAYTYVGSARPW